MIAFLDPLWRIVAAFALVIAGVWCFLAIRYQGPGSDALRFVLGVIAAAPFVIVAIALATGRAALMHFLALTAYCALLALWWSTIKPVENQDWAADVARKPVIDIDGDDVTVGNVRDFVWSGAETIAEQRWETRRYHLGRLKTLDVFTSVWGNPNIAHVFLSFGFEDEGYLSMSVEVRRARGETYDPIASTFRRNNLVLVAADEADVAKVRANFRGEKVSRFRISARPPVVRRLFHEYAALSQALNAAPMFYNTITTNCTTTEFFLARDVVGATLPLDWRILLSGHLPDYLYDLGVLSHEASLAETRADADVTALSKDAGELRGEPYSEYIRQNQNLGDAAWLSGRAIDIARR